MQDEAQSQSDALIGHTRAWVRYEFDTYDLRMESFDDGHLWKATLMDEWTDVTLGNLLGAASSSGSASMAVGLVARRYLRAMFGS